MTKPTLGYSPLTGTTYVLLRNGQKRAVPEPELVAVIAGYLDDHHLSVTKPDGTVVRYGVLDENSSRMMQSKYDHAGPGTVAMEDISPALADENEALRQEIRKFQQWIHAAINDSDPEADCEWLCQKVCAGPCQGFPVGPVETSDGAAR